jgi:hypothetical protein
VIQRGFSISATDFEIIITDFSFVLFVLKSFVRETQTSFALQGFMLEFNFVFIMVLQIGSTWMHHHGNRGYRLDRVVLGWWTIAEAGRVICQNQIRNMLMKQLR